MNSSESSVPPHPSVPPSTPGAAPNRDLLRILGLVVGVHAAVFLFVIAIPGCRSTGGTTAGNPPATPTAPAAMPSVAPAPFNPDAPAQVRPIRPDAPVAVAPMPPATPVSTPPVAPAPPPAESYTVKSGDSLWSIAQKNNLTVATLAAANRLTPDARLSVGQKLILPATGPRSAAPTASAAVPPAGTSTYVVKSGDTLGAIAQRHRTTAAALRTLNNLRSDTLHVGDRLSVPVASGSAAPVASDPTATTAGGGGRVHVVKPGETLGAIARLYNVRQADIALANNISDPTKLSAGRELKIPGWKPTATPSTTPIDAPVAPAPAPPSAAPVAPAPPPPSLPALAPPNFGASPAVTPAPAPTAPRTGPEIRIEDGGAPRIWQEGATR